MITDDCDITSRYRLSLTTITITMFNGMNFAQWETQMALLLGQKQVYGIIEGSDDKPEEPSANTNATEKAVFKDWINRHAFPHRLPCTAWNRGY